MTEEDGDEGGLGLTTRLLFISVHWSQIGDWGVGVEWPLVGRLKCYRKLKCSEFFPQRCVKNLGNFLLVNHKYQSAVSKVLAEK